MPSPFRHNIEFSTIGLLQERSAAWKKGKSQSHWDASVRNPAYVTISCAGVSLPRNEKTFGEVYDNFKPGPLLKNVTLIQFAWATAEAVWFQHFAAKFAHSPHGFWSARIIAV